MKYFFLLLIMLVIYPLQVQAEDRTEEITPSHQYWTEIKSYLPEGTRDLTGIFHKGANGFYVAVLYNVDIVTLETDEKVESDGLLIGEIGGNWISVGNDFDQIHYSYPKVEFTTFVTEGELVDLVLIQSWQMTYGANYWNEFINAFRLDEDDTFSNLESGNVCWFPYPAIRERRSCNLQIAPELNGVIIWAQNPAGYDGDWENPFQVIQYLYVYDNNLCNNMILVKCDKTEGFYSVLPEEPPFVW